VTGYGGDDNVTTRRYRRRYPSRSESSIVVRAATRDELQRVGGGHAVRGERMARDVRRALARAVQSGGGATTEGTVADGRRRTSATLLPLRRIWSSFVTRLPSGVISL